MKSDGLCRWSQLSSSVSAGKGVRGARLCVNQPSVLDLSGTLIVVTRSALHWGCIRFLRFPVNFTCAIYDLGTSWPVIVMFNLTHPYTCGLGAGDLANRMSVIRLLKMNSYVRGLPRLPAI